MRPAIPPLSKSRFMAGLQCHKRLWLELYEPEEAGETDPGTQWLLDQGTQVGQLARGYFPGGELIDEDHLHHDQALAHTERALADPSLSAVYEAAFRYDDVRIRADLLARGPKGAFDLAEVKSSTQVKPEHLWDVAIQAYVLEGAGRKLRRKCVLTIDTRYVYPGGDHDPRRLFKLDDVTPEVNALLPQVPGLLEAMRQPLWQMIAPAVEIGEQCHAPYGCPFIGHCHPPGPEHPVTELPRASRKLRERLAEDGIAAIPDIPEHYAGLSAIQARIRDAVASGRPYLDPAINGVLQELPAPIFFLDFETVNPAVPLHAGMRPYQVIPFQWSAHRLDVNDAMQHFEYLHDGPDDPRPEFLRTLLETLGRQGAVCVYSHYEKTQLKQLREALPAHAQAIDAVVERIVDLLPLVRGHVYHPEFHGSFSIKNVYPALVPDAGYGDLAISDGSSASAAYMTLISAEVAPTERQSVRRDLLDYCRRDTEAMVQLYGVLKGK